MKGRIYECCEECPHHRLSGNLAIQCSKGAKEYHEGDSFFADCPLPDMELVRYGGWKEIDGEDSGNEWYCTSCKHEMAFVYDMGLEELKEFYKYYPNCGANMDGEKHES